VAPFCCRLADDPTLQAELRDMVTINVFEFFRDTSQWTQLHMSLMPELLESKSRLKIWSAAYSNVQEPYTIAMILDDLSAADRAQIIATDLDRDALARTRAGGPYSADDLKGVPAGMRDRYFESAEDGTT
jgi:chemotaxis protein methyltransferase CheR